MLTLLHACTNVPLSSARLPTSFQQPLIICRNFCYQIWADLGAAVGVVVHLFGAAVVVVVHLLGAAVVHLLGATVVVVIHLLRAVLFRAVHLLWIAAIVVRLSGAVVFRAVVVVYFDQLAGASHIVCWPKSFFWHLNKCFYLKSWLTPKRWLDPGENMTSIWVLTSV